MDRVEQFSIIAPDIGNIFRFISIGTAVPLLITLIYQEWNMLLPMASVPITLFLLGTLLTRVPHREREPPLSAALMAVAIIWLICAIVGALPFTLGIGMPYLDSVFEAMSGWTDTGLTLAPDIDTLPKTLLFWRSLMQWLGGIGIVAFTIAMASRTGLTQFRLYRSEGRSEALMPSVVATGLEMWKIYLVLTAASVGMILLSGIPVWDAINIALVGISTGGFSVHAAGIPYYDNPLLEILIIPVMIAGALPFKLYYYMYNKKGVKFFGDSQARLLFILIAVGIVVIAWDLVTLSFADTPTAIRQALFMSIAAATSTGFQIELAERMGERHGALPLDADGDRWSVREHCRRYQALPRRPRYTESFVVVPEDARLGEGARSVQVRGEGHPEEYRRPRGLPEHAGDHALFPDHLHRHRPRDAPAADRVRVEQCHLRGRVGDVQQRDQHRVRLPRYVRLGKGALHHDHVDRAS